MSSNLFGKPFQLDAKRFEIECEKYIWLKTNICELWRHLF